MIIDGHVHMGRGEFGTFEELKKSMTDAKIDKAVLVPGGMIDVRRMTKYITGEEVANGEYIPNDVIEAIIKAEPEKFYGFYCVNPHKRNQALEDFENGIKSGFSGLKLAPIVHNFSLSSQTVKELAKLCGELDVPFYSHVVFSPGANTNKFMNLVKSFPKTKFILGHMGFGPCDVDAIEYASKYENLFLETSQGSFAAIKMALDKCGSTKLIYGSEFPLYRPNAGLVNILELECNSNDFENIVCNNIRNILE